MLKGDSPLSLGCVFTPSLANREAPYALRFLKRIGLVDRAGTFSKWHIKEIKHASNFRGRRKLNPHHEVSSTNLRRTVFTESLGLYPIDVEQVAKSTRRPMPLNLLPPILVATELNVGFDPKRIR